MRISRRLRQNHKAKQKNSPGGAVSKPQTEEQRLEEEDRKANATQAPQADELDKQLKPGDATTDEDLHEQAPASEDLDKMLEEQKKGSDLEDQYTKMEERNIDRHVPSY